MDPRAFWVGMNYVKGIGAVRLQGLLDFFGDLALAWEAPYDALRSAGLSQKIADTFVQVRSQIDLEVIWQRIHEAGISVLTWNDTDYPQILKEIDQPPPVLYYKGDLISDDETAVAIVGTRRVTTYGKNVTEELAGFLARNGITVVSGLARGVDAAAHAAALQAGGRTIAVLGSGVDQIYPPEHRRLAEEIAEAGAVLSDYPPGTKPDSANFPPRNRIISGLSLATIVIEAGESSGALITASFAAEQGREVLAVPGNIYSPASKGTNRLILNGARPLLRVEDVLDAINLKMVSARQIAKAILPANETESKILTLISNQAYSADEIGFLAGLPISQVSATLTMMELKGMVRNTGGMNYQAVHEDQDPYHVENYG